MTARRAVLLTPLPHHHFGPPAVACADYAAKRGFTVVSVAHDAVSALGEIAGGRADVVVVLRPDQLLPVVEVVTDMTAPSAAQRRPQRRDRRSEVFA